ncbi:MAG: hypothetical protein KUG52_05620 [Immundisolibacteraceae bacterium]|nr:hypothetical protein [Immundisolibacteraceae bacterium]
MSRQQQPLSRSVLPRLTQSQHAISLPLVSNSPVNSDPLEKLTAVGPLTGINEQHRVNESVKETVTVDVKLRR